LEKRAREGIERRRHPPPPPYIDWFELEFISFN